MSLCPRCETWDPSWNARCPSCGGFALRPMAGGAEDNTGEDELPQSISITFTLRSGEAVEVREFLDGPATEQAIRAFGELLAADLGNDKVRTFGYWYDEDFYMDAVLMDEVAAFSITADWGEEEEDDE